MRRAPGSRRYPHFSRGALEGWLPRAGVAYHWEQRLGGWRRPDPHSRNTALRNASFRGYADYMQGDDFWQALDGVLDRARRARTAIMCSEAVYWRCHRRLIADASSLVRRVEVRHLHHDGRLVDHLVTSGARVDKNRVVYDRL